jgi:hypothetical protein
MTGASGDFDQVRPQIERLTVYQVELLEPFIVDPLDALVAGAAGAAGGAPAARP